MSFKIESHFYGRKWNFTKEEIENLSPSRKDGIDLKSESYLRKLYCTFIQEIGIKLKVPQVTIASGMMLCHQFYMRQSLAKNDWQTVATACIFLVCKSEETPRYLNDVVVLSYETMNKWDPSAPRRIRQREVFDKQKEVILVAERLVLSTLAFDLNIQLPYKPLITALKRLEIFPDLTKVAWNFINDWIRTTLCLQYKPHYIAAGSLFLAAKLQKVKLPTQKGRVWWMEFDVTLKQLEEVIQDMRRLLGQDKKPPPVSIDRRPLVKNPLESSSESSVTSSHSVVDCSRNPANDRESKPYNVSEHTQNLAKSDNRERVENDLPCGTSNSARSGVEDGDVEVQPSTTPESGQKPQPKAFSDRNSSSKIDVDRIREAMKKRKREMIVKPPVEQAIGGVEIDSEAWIESQLENGIELRNERSEKKQRKL